MSRLATVCNLVDSSTHSTSRPIDPPYHPNITTFVVVDIHKRKTLASFKPKKSFAFYLLRYVEYYRVLRYHKYSTSSKQLRIIRHNSRSPVTDNTVSITILKVSPCNQPFRKHDLYAKPPLGPLSPRAHLNIIIQMSFVCITDRYEPRAALCK
ncbi:hypothetical protein J6590_027162 [Homalodisca vitripennis]|nr:hypothetical protein J6590_027162 [Homalodisca vitripennis]